MNGFLEALYYNDQEPIVVALTGYTGVGCSTARDILVAADKPHLPGFKVISLQTKHVTPMDERVYGKLARKWDTTAWEPFIPIEVSKIIFGFLLLTLQGESKKLDWPKERDAIMKRASAEGGKLDGLRWFAEEEEPLEREDAEAMLEAYAAAKRIYTPFKDAWKKRLRGEFVTLLQDCGDAVRRCGHIPPGGKAAEITPDCIFSLPRAIGRLIRAFTRARSSRAFVIDTVKNPYEIEYLRRQFSNFQLVGVLRDADKREKSLLERLDFESLKAIEKREKAESFKGEERLTSQDVDECIRHADMFIYNRESETRTFEHLRFGLIKLITLIKRPGCVTPTQDERCMQLAMTVRLASGCISRQVGAVVVDSERRVCGIGWNDPPRGQIPCSLRTCEELTNDAVVQAFSEFERSERVIKHVKTLPQVREPFCFRTEWGLMQGKKDAEFTRALHAEENALIQAVTRAPVSLKDASLYTTARTCNLCAKKAYQLGISRIVYIDEYYDIAIQQTIMAGSRGIVIERFSGITGAAYHRLYAAPIPEKEMIGLMYPPQLGTKPRAARVVARPAPAPVDGTTRERGGSSRKRKRRTRRLGGGKEAGGRKGALKREERGRVERGKRERGKEGPRGKSGRKSTGSAESVTTD